MAPRRAGRSHTAKASQISTGLRSAASRAFAKTKSPLVSGLSSNSLLQKSGAGEGIRTLDPDLGKVVLYH
jgi:hypothetical protein